MCFMITDISLGILISNISDRIINIYYKLILASCLRLMLSELKVQK